MSFGFSAIGDRDQVTAQLQAVSGDDSLKDAIVGLLAEHVGKSELHGYRAGDVEFREQYVIKASGHSGPQSTLNLLVDVATVYVPVVEPTVDELARELTEALVDETGGDVVDATIDDDED